MCPNQISSTFLETLEAEISIDRSCHKSLSRAHLYRTSLGQHKVRPVGRGLAVDPRLAPVAGEDLALGEVEVHCEEAVVLAVVHVPLLPRHVPPTLPRVPAPESRFRQNYYY